MKRVLVFLSVATLLFYGAFCAIAEDVQVEQFVCGDYTYILQDDGSVMITKYVGNARKYVIPEEIDNKKITGIGDKAFSDNYSLKSVTIPDCVTDIGANPFANCRKLTEIIVSPEHTVLAVIDDVLFNKIDKSLVAFPSGSSRTDYVIPQGIRAIDEIAFCGCGGLTSITIPDSVTRIGNRAFLGCSELSSVMIPNSVVEVGDNPFIECQQLKEIVVSPDHTVLAVTDGILFNKSENSLLAFPCDSTVSEYDIPQGVTKIGGYAFNGCYNLASITIPDSVTKIGDYAFNHCGYLLSITIPNGVMSIGEGAFTDCINLISVTLPESVMSVGKKAFNRCCSLESITISDNMISIGDYVFSGCNGLISVTIPDSVMSIGEGAFEFCNGLTSVTIPNNVVSIGKYAFYGCENLTTIKIPKSVMSIGEGAFEFCGSLTCSVDHISYAKQYCKENRIKYSFADMYDWLNN